MKKLFELSNNFFVYLSCERSGKQHQNFVSQLFCHALNSKSCRNKYLQLKCDNFTEALQIF